ncbi:MAG: hypothetical protein ABUL60_11100, partial [Myxococcales bacterium]
MEVPKDQIYFPVGLALSRDGNADGNPDYLFVVSSDFDLQYNGGAVQSYDLTKLTEQLPRRCVVDADCAIAEDDQGPTQVPRPFCQPGGMCAASRADSDSPCPQGDRADADRLLFPGRCNPIEPRKLQISAVKIGAFATDVLLRERPESTPELSVPVGLPERLFVPVRGDS